MEGNTSAGYKHIHLQPFIPDGLNAAEASVETVAGTIRSGWTRQDDSFLYRVSIPANTTGSIVIPVFKSQKITITEGGTNIWENESYKAGVPGIKEVKKETGLVKITIESGNYEFEVREM
jgi:alpha-L-rhamnosidase